MRVMACHRYKREDRNARTKLTRGPPYTARDEVNMNLIGCPICWPWFRAASRTVRTESTFTYGYIDQRVVTHKREQLVVTLTPKSKLSSDPRDMIP